MQVTTVTTVQNSIRDTKTELVLRTVTRRVKMSDRSVIDQLTARAPAPMIMMFECYEVEWKSLQLMSLACLDVPGRAQLRGQYLLSIAAHRIRDL